MDTQSQAVEPQTLNLTLNPQEMQVIFAGLQELPIKIAQGLWRKLEQEIGKQIGETRTLEK